MIQPNEKLLPGNVVMYHSVTGDKIEVLSIQRIFTIDQCNFWFKYDPIPLTPEILVQWCWFEDNGYVVTALFGNSYVSIVFEDNFLAIVDSSPNGNTVNVKLPEHLHTLQNTVYFLSGEEMPVNIPNH